jgi:hypothetical protein
VLVVRRPEAAEEMPENASVAVISGDRVDQERLTSIVTDLRFPMPLRSFDRSGWVLEPPDVRALMERIQRENQSLSSYTGVAPQYGIKTGLNEAYLVDTTTRDDLISGGVAHSLFQPFLRGQDIERWSSNWSGKWMILLKSSGDHAWPWAHETDEAVAEAIFASTFPQLYARMVPLKQKLKAREDQGRFWWELRACGYYDAFDRPKIIYQEIQFYPAYSLEVSGFCLNNKGFMIGSSDSFLLAALNSPLLWWFGWRHFAHMKDEALTPQGFRMETLPIARPNQQQAESAASLTARLADIHRKRHDARRALADWLRVEWNIARAPTELATPFGLSADAFAESLRKALLKKRKMTVAEVAAIKHAHAETIAPISTLLREANSLERQLSHVINAAYRLTPEEEALMWRTAPPRMPISPPASAAAAAQ